MAHMSSQGSGSGDRGTPSAFADFIAANVRAACGRRHVSQTELVRRTGISKSSMGRKWNGQDAFDVAEIEKIGLALSARFSELLEGKPGPMAQGSDFAGTRRVNVPLPVQRSAVVMTLAAA